MKLSVAWLVGTFVLFLGGNQLALVPDLMILVVFIVATVIAFVVGYGLKIQQYGKTLPEIPLIDKGEVQRSRRWVLIGAIYYGIYGISLIAEYGEPGPAAILEAIANPGTSYVARLRANDVISSEINPLVQFLTLFAAIATPLVPFAILYWKRLGIGTQILALTGLAIYSSYWLSIGTLKGLGDVAVYAATAVLVLQKGAWPALRDVWRRHPDRTHPAIRGRRGQRYTALLVLIAAPFIAYMVYNQAERLEASNISAYEPNAVVAEIAGERLARGFTVTVFYPTHGYLGLAHNLETPFKWTAMRGGSGALDSYLAQYGAGPSVFPDTYPARTEQLTGWPALMNWATIYPWLASDLTFPGTVLFMGFVGWWMARFWYEAAVFRSRLAVLMLCQLMILIAYVPANNQVALTRPNFIAFASLAALYLWRRFRRHLWRRSTRRSVRAPGLSNSMGTSPPNALVTRGAPNAHFHLYSPAPGSVFTPPTIVNKSDG